NEKMAKVQQTPPCATPMETGELEKMHEGHCSSNEKMANVHQAPPSATPRSSSTPRKVMAVTKTTQTDDMKVKQPKQRKVPAKKNTSPVETETQTTPEATLPCIKLPSIKVKPVAPKKKKADAKALPKEEAPATQWRVPMAPKRKPSKKHPKTQKKSEDSYNNFMTNFLVGWKTALPVMTTNKKH